MKSDEFKLRLDTYVSNLIDQYSPADNFTGRMVNGTMKFWFNQNKGKLFKVIDIFADENGCIGEAEIREYLNSSIFENGQLKLDVKSMIPQNMELVKGLLPDKIILLNENDIDKLIGSVPYPSPTVPSAVQPAAMPQAAEA